MRVLDHDDRRVDHGADGDRDAAKGHDVGANPSAFMAMNAMRMPTGSIMMATSALRTCSRKTKQTSATMMLSSMSVYFSVAMAYGSGSERS